MPARSRRVDEQRREPLHPPKQSHVIDGDAALREELLEIAIRQPEPQIPRTAKTITSGGPEPHERRRLFDGGCGTTATLHHRTLADPGRSVNATVP